MRQGRLALVCGGREFLDRKFVFDCMDRIHKERIIGCVVEGGAKGADRLGRLWAIINRIPVIEVDAHWETMGRAAGTIRNKWMIDWCSPDFVIAFPGSAGTRDMMRCAANARIEVIRCPLTS